MAEAVQTVQTAAPGASAAVREEYACRLADRRAALDRLTQADRSLGNTRLAVFAAMAAAFWAAYAVDLAFVYVGAALLAAFIWLVVRHDRTIRARERAERAVRFYERGIERLEDRWQGGGVSGARYASPDHPYAVDLDIFGRGSLFELLCAARTPAGERCLADWLAMPATAEVVRARQGAVADLRPRLDAREELALAGEEARGGASSADLAAWVSQPPLLPRSDGLRALAFGIAALTVAAGGLWAAGGSSLPFWALAFAGRALAAALTRPVRNATHDVMRPAADLTHVAELLARLERGQFEAPLLLGLQGALNVAGARPSARIARLDRLADWLKADSNIAFMPFAALLLWRVQFAFAVEEWRRRNAPFVADWLRAIGEFEALVSLAGYAYERPEDPFPEVADGDAGAPELLAEGIAHPLLPIARAIRNDVALGDTRLLIVSGSNMSGKSTLLRTLGANVVLALAGAPVRAARLRLVPMRVGASIRTQDSLEGGVSRFYAEITRLRQILELATDHPPALFLLDEILHGTNSHDRLIGAEALARALVERGAIGLMTTHDLALARIADDPAARAGNVHFQDHLEEGRMVFDYRLRPGVVEKSNAIELMRAVGLPV